MNRIILLNLVLLLVVSCPAEAGTITVKADGTGDYPTIQAAIDAAVNGDEVVAEDGTYRRAGNRDIDFKGKAITVRSKNGPENCVINCKSAGRGFYFHSGEDATSVLSGFTIKGGSALRGGGIYCRSGPTLINCEIRGNTAEDEGGGIFCEYESSPTFIDCTIRGNTAQGGGGIYCWGSSSPTLINCTIRGNRTTRDDGGGIYCDYGGRPTLANCTIVGNTAKDEGGGIYLRSGSILTNCTVVANYAENSGGGLFCADNYVPRLTNCIFWDNEDDSGTGQLSQIKGGRPEVIYSCIQDDDANDADIPFGDANGNIDDRPMFVRAPDDGGDGWGVGNDDFGDIHLKVVSPCIDSGLPDFVAGPRTDMDGQPRVMGLRIDMGADEYRTKEIIVTIPKGGEIWAASSTHEIQWSSYGAGQVDILLSKNAGGNWQSIESGVSDNGGYSWHILNKYCSEQAQVKVVPSEPDANVICIESGVFVIVPYQGPASLPQRPKEPGIKPVAEYGPEFGCVKWKFETVGPVTAGVTIGRKIGRQRKVYAACEDGRLYALDLETGALIWSYDVNSPLVGSAAEGLQGSVYVGGRDGRLYALDKEGKLLWTHTTDAPLYSSPVVSPQEQIYVCSEEGTLYALRRNGSELWRYETGGFAKLDGSIFATLRIADDGTVYIAGLYDPNLYALNPEDGSVKWRCNFAPSDPCAPGSVGRRSGWPFASPAVAPDGTIYQTLLYDPNLYAVEPDTGTIIWSTDLAGTLMWYKNFIDIEHPDWYIREIFIWYGSGDPPEYVEGHELYLIGRHKHAPSWSSPALGPDGTIYVSFDDPYLRAVDPDGSVKWATRLGIVGGLTVTVGDDGLVYAASTDNKLYVVEPTGEEVARFESDGWLSHPVIAPGRTIIVSDANNTVWAITQEDCGDKPVVLDVPPEPNEP
ncbi:MAG: outer membrane protein assembly factor BamB family protein [Planctomycetota bacterium]|jgi:parallel beta-helix repeat protein